MAAPVLEGVGSGAPEFDTDAGGNTLTVNNPANTASGDVLYTHLLIGNVFDSTVFNAPSGWTNDQTFQTSGGTGGQTMYDVLTAAAASTQDFIKSGNGGDLMGGATMRISGADTADPIDVSATATGNSNSPECPSVTTTVDDCLILRICSYDNNNTLSVPGGTTQIYAGQTSLASDGAMAASWEVQATAGATGTANFSVSASRAWVTFTIAIKPPAGGGAITLEAESGSYTFSGTDATLTIDRTLTAESGSYAFSGTDATLVLGRLLSAESGSFAFTGTDANLIEGQLLEAESGPFAFAGQDATLTRARSLSVDSGTFSFTGQDATLSKTGALIAESGPFAFAGQDAGLLFDRILTAESGAFAFAGQDAGLFAARLIEAESGTFGFTGEDATLRIDRTLTAESGAFDWLGQDATLRVTAPNTLPASPGNYGYLGQSAEFLFDRVLTAESGAFGFTGRPATLSYSEDIQLAGRPTLPRRRRYVLPDGQVFEDPDRALFELRRLLAREASAKEPGPAVSRPGPDAANIGPVVAGPGSASSLPTAPQKSLTPRIMQNVVADLPDMIEARPRTSVPIDPQLLSVLLQRIDDEEASLLLL